MICPHCQQEMDIGTAGPFDVVFMSRKTCEKCRREFLIVNGAPMKPEDYRSPGEA
jgi:transposase-like protein